MKIHYLFPEAASAFASKIDVLYWALVAMSLVLSIGIFVAILVLAVKYRRTPERQSGVAVLENKYMEIIWSVIPLVIGLGIFAWAAVLYLETRVPPKGSLEIAVVGKQWMWKVQHPEGKREINELHMPVGKPIVLRMISQDVIHSFYIPAFRIKQDVLPQRYTTMWFQADKVGTFHLFCAEYCGKDHSEMIGRVVVMTPEAYDAWLQQDKTPAVNGPLVTQASMVTAPAVISTSAASTGGGSGMVEQGKELFTRLACVGCHAVENGVGPKLDGLFGTTVELNNGKKVKVDENYLRESILNPGAKIVKGHNNLMPSFAGRVSEEDILSLISYIKTLGRTP